MTAIAAILSALTEKPQMIEVIGKRTGLERREVEQALEAIRRDGLAPVCAGSDGIWSARTLAEYERHVERHQQRAVRQLVNVRGERRLLRRLREPLTLWREGA